MLNIAVFGADGLLRADDALAHRPALARAGPRAAVPHAGRHADLGRRARARGRARWSRPSWSTRRPRSSRSACTPRRRCTSPLLAPPPGRLGARGGVRRDRQGRSRAGALMDLKELRKAVEDGSIDTVLLGFADMQGRFQGKRLVGRPLPRGGGLPRRGGVQLPAGRRRRHEHRRGLRDVLVGDGLRRLRDEAGLRHAAARALARGHGDVHGRPAVARRQAGHRVAAPDPAPPARPARRARLDRVRGHRARVHRLPRHLRAGVPQALPRASSPATSTTSTTRCSGPRGWSR